MHPRPNDQDNQRWNSRSSQYHQGRGRSDRDCPPGAPSSRNAPPPPRERTGPVQPGRESFNPIRFRSVDAQSVSTRSQPMQRAEWLAMSKQVYQTGSKIDVLVFKILLELLLDPKNGIPIHHLSHFSNAMLRSEKKLNSNQRLSSEHAGLETVLNALKDGNDTQNDKDGHKKQQEREAVGQLVDNVRYFFDPLQDAEFKRLNREGIPVRGNYGDQGRRQFSAGADRVHPRRPRREAAVENDELFMTLMRERTRIRYWAQHENN